MLERIKRLNWPAVMLAILFFSAGVLANDLWNAARDNALHNWAKDFGTFVAATLASIFALWKLTFDKRQATAKQDDAFAGLRTALLRHLQMLNLYWRAVDWDSFEIEENRPDPQRRLRFQSDLVRTNFSIEAYKSYVDQLDFSRKHKADAFLRQMDHTITSIQGILRARGEEVRQSDLHTFRSLLTLVAREAKKFDPGGEVSRVFSRRHGAEIVEWSILDAGHEYFDKLERDRKRAVKKT
jgi:hypothetical protein